MSDIGRESLSDKVSSSVKPDSQKTTTESISDSASGAYDKVAGAVQPEGQKSTSQKASDTLSGNTTDDASKQGKSYLESAKDTVNSALGTDSSK